MVRRKSSVSAQFDQWTRWSLAGILIGLVLAAIYWRATPVRESDPDRYFHLEMAKRAADTGNLHQIEEVSELNSGDTFTNSYWLFTYLSSLGYRVAGEEGVLAFGFVCAMATLLLLLWIAHENLSIGVSMLIIAGVLLSPDAANRLFLFRPHLLSIFLFTVMVFGMLRSNFYVTFIVGALHALSYQAPFIPGAILVLAIPFGKRQGREWVIAAGAGLIGLCVGILAHPYFPGNVYALLGTLAASVPSQTVSPFSMPIEFGGLSLTRVVMNLSFFSLPLVLMVIRIVPSFRKAIFKQEFKSAPMEMVWLVCCLTFFWGLSLVTSRAFEYVIPLAVLAWVFFLRDWKYTPSQARYLAAGMVLCLPVAWTAYVEDVRVRLSPNDLISAIRALPENAEGKKVLNMEWAHGAHILYARPGYRIVDYGDPRWLARKRPDLFDMRSQLQRGEIADPYGVVRFVFDASYVLTFAGGLQSQLEASPHFRKVSEVELTETPGQKIYLYEASIRRLPLQVKKFDLRSGSDRQVTSGSGEDWKQWGSSSALPEERRTTFVNLGPGRDGGCTLLRPKFEDQGAVMGANLVAMGGGGDIRLSFNDEKLFRGYLGAKGLRETELVLRLPRALTKRDRILVEVCGKGSEVVTGFTMSLFTPRVLDALCQWKYGKVEEKQASESWKYGTVAAASCLAPYATRQE